MESMVEWEPAVNPTSDGDFLAESGCSVSVDCQRAGKGSDVYGTSVTDGFFLVVSGGLHYSL